MTKVTGIILAAGAGRRMGRPKQLLPWGETTVLGQTIHHAQQSSLNDLIVVTGHAATAVAAIARTFGVATIHNHEYATGEMLSSLQTAVAALPSDCDGIVALLADQPFVDATIIDALLAAFRAGHGPIVAPTFQGRRGNPVLIGRDFFPALLELPQGAAPRALLASHPTAVYPIPVDDEAVLRDLDDEGDYRRWHP